MRLDYKWRAAIVVALGLFMAVLDNTIVSVALPQMQAYFHTDRDTINWVATGYLLSQAAIIPITGYLSDRIGTKLVFLVALALFTVGSGLCAIAPSEQWLITFRVFQGIGGGALFPMAFAIVFRVFPPDQRGPAGALIGVPVLLAPAFGPTLGGYLTTTFDWHAIFTINLPVGVVAFVLALVTLHSGKETGEPALDRQRLDIAGLLLAVTSSTALVYGISEAGPKGWSDPTVLKFLIGGGILLIAFVITELRVSDPVLDVRLFLNYTFTISNVLLWAISAFLFGGIYLLPVFFQNVQGHTPLASGEYVISQGVAAAIGTLIAGRFYNSVGPRTLAVIGFALVTAGTFGFTQLDVNTTWQSLQPWMVLRGLGLGFTNIPLQTLALAVVSNKQMARASSLSSATRQIFGAVGISVLFTILTQQVAHYVSTQRQSLIQSFAAGGTLDPSTPLGQAVAACSKHFGANVPAVQACVTQAAQQYVGAHVQTMGLNDVFVVSMIGTGVCTLIALFVGRDPAVEAAKRAKARGESVQPRAAVIGE
ncbi:MAG: putative MFS-type transporter [Ktedonobacterales bacterium]|jgi:EmrB/QacA subfamily drug resistance transporter|nr:MAG: putative MFS-type transporter [Ktedonobacterales bacterium]